GRFPATDYWSSGRRGIRRDQAPDFIWEPAEHSKNRPAEQRAEIPPEPAQYIRPRNFHRPQRPKIIKPPPPESSRQRIIELTKAVRAAGKKEERIFRMEIRKSANKRGEINPR